MSSATAHAHDNTYGQDDTYLYHHFDDLNQQHESSSLGMWAFLATEVLFFGGVLGAFAIFQTMYAPAMRLASHHLDVMLGAVNTGVLLVSSLAMALAVRAAQLRRDRETIWLLIATIVLGSAFLGVKAYEWIHDYHLGLVPGLGFRLDLYPGRQILFWSFYFTLTGIHALHMIIGIVIMAIMAVLVWRRWFSGGGATQVEMLGLYWHFVDIVWVFLYPILYLINR
ncbi:cytochrome c oxidase subunit 3 [Tautonia plasticadhaerens]|uniref:Quinol oxidase subunit 3 n=1 Tax=Tautonia plasticadhaerens TaxID=2527974 RepID=A0A518H8J6_9BACT|nr:cytochrome c oxidase subunit 3 [Tautonia plasticadhaerens]QDV37096.1 Quinol oxidase subunit 3 [Tautonia plasticadhaerens]